MVPRSFQYANPRPSWSSTAIEKEAALGGRKQKQEKTKALPTTKPANPSKMCMVTPATISRPVVIPTRSHSPRQRNRKEPIAMMGRLAPLVPRNDYGEASIADGSDALERSRNALLDAQSASISGLIIAARDPSLLQIDPVSDKAPHQARPWHSLSDSSPHTWDLLQTPPHDSDTDNWSLGSDSTVAPLSSFRSLSGDSMPSLDNDTDSPGSASHPSTPGNRAGRRDRRLTSLSASFVEECGFDHPLSPSNNVSKVNDTDITRASDVDDLSPNISMPVQPSRSLFKSNLTASLRVLKSAAQSFSNMAVQRDEFLTRSILSITPQYTDERRPLLSVDVPDPALRRYLNPIMASPSELHFHCQHSTRHVGHDQCTISIQLQTVTRADPPWRNATSPRIFVPSSRDASEFLSTVQAPPPSRQREARMNSDFLRVIVLELNMRKAGKLNETPHGRARYMLPARHPSKPEEIGPNGVPRRWSGIVE